MWDNQYTERLVVEAKPILLVPKRSVSFTDKYTPSEYKQHFVLNFLQHENLQLHTSLVRKYKNGIEYVTKKSIREKEGVIDKEYLARFSEQHPEVFADFKRQTAKKLSHVDGAVLDNLNLQAVCE